MELNVVGNEIQSESVSCELGGCYTVSLLESKDSVGTTYKIVTYWNSKEGYTENHLCFYKENVATKEEALTVFNAELEKATDTIEALKTIRKK